MPKAPKPPRVPSNHSRLRLVSTSDATESVVTGAVLSLVDEVGPPLIPGVPPLPPSPARAWAKEAYLTFRASPKCASRLLTLDQMLSILATKRDRLPPDAPPADRVLLETWEKEGGWEASFREQELTETLESEGLKPDRRLSALLRTEQEAKEVLEQAINIAKQPNATKDDVQQYNTALTAWTNLQARIADAESDTRRRAFEAGDQDQWGQRYQTLVSDLMVSYKDLGPQYDVIVRQLARQQLRMEKAEASGRDVPLAEYNEGTKLVIQLVGQLQKYTEATKSEAIHREQQEAILAVLREVESELSEYPQLWQRIAKRIHQRITSTTPIPVGGRVSA